MLLKTSTSDLCYHWSCWWKVNNSLYKVYYLLYSNINQIYILKNSKGLLDNFNSRIFSKISSIQTFDYSTLYTTISLKTPFKGNYSQRILLLKWKVTLQVYSSGSRTNLFWQARNERQTVLHRKWSHTNVEVHRHLYGNKLCALLVDLFLYSYRDAFIQNSHKSEGRGCLHNMERKVLHPQV